jgi:hypothetical protein
MAFMDARIIQYCELYFECLGLERLDSNYHFDKVCLVNSLKLLMREVGPSSDLNRRLDHKTFSKFRDRFAVLLVKHLAFKPIITNMDDQESAKIINVFYALLVAAHTQHGLKYPVKSFIEKNYPYLFEYAKHIGKSDHLLDLEETGRRLRKLSP